MRAKELYAALRKVQRTRKYKVFVAARGKIVIVYAESYRDAVVKAKAKSNKSARRAS